MEPTSTKLILRWVLALPVAVFGFALGILPAIWLNKFILFILFQGRHSVPHGLFLAYVVPWDAAICASLFVVFGTLMAPSHKSAAALALFLIGAGLVWFMGAKSSNWHDPAIIFSGSNIGAYLGGLAAYVGVVLYTRRRDRASKAEQLPQPDL